MDDIFIKYTNKKDTDHLLDALKAQYVMYEDWAAKLYRGVKLNRDYQKMTCNLSIPNYLIYALEFFNTPNLQEHSMHHTHE